MNFFPNGGWNKGRSNAKKLAAKKASEAAAAKRRKDSQLTSETSELTSLLTEPSDAEISNAPAPINVVINCPVPALRSIPCCIPVPGIQTGSGVASQHICNAGPPPKPAPRVKRKVAKIKESRLQKMGWEESNKLEANNRKKLLQQQRFDRMTKEEKEAARQKKLEYGRAFRQKSKLNEEYFERARKQRERMQRVRKFMSGITNPLRDWRVDPSVHLQLLHEMCLPLLSADDYRALKNSPEMKERIKKLFCPITQQETQSQINDFRQHIHPSSIMYGCAVCGIRVIPFGLQGQVNHIEKFPLSELQSLLEYTDNDEKTSPLKEGSTILDVHNIQQNRRFKMAIHQGYMETQENVYSLDSKALLCSSCARCIREDRLPVMCLKMWDFGMITQLPSLSVLENLLIQRVRVFLHVAKLVDGKKQFALSGHCMAIPTDAAERVAQQRGWDISVENRQFPRNVTAEGCGLSVMFVGTLDKWERIMEGSGPNDFKATSIYRRIFQVKWRNIILWLHFLKKNSPAYKDVEIADDDDLHLQLQVESLPSVLLHKDNVQIASDALVAQLEEKTRANQPGAPQMDIEINSEVPVNEGAIDASAIPGHFASFLVEPGPVANAGGEEDEDKIQVQQAYEALSGAGSEGKSAPSPPSPLPIGHGNELVNEFTDIQLLFSCGFPTLFPLGYPGEKIPTPSQLEHMLMQADNRCADSTEFIFYCFNLRSRIAAINGTASLWKCSPKKLKQLKELLDEDGFMEKLERAAKSFQVNPSAPMSNTAKEILLKILPLMVAAGKKVPYGNCGNTELALCQMIACRRFFGNFTYFFTINPVVQDYGLALRMASPIVNNSDLKGEAWRLKELDGLQTHSSRTAILDTHPIGASLMYLRLHSAVWNFLMRCDYPEPGSHLKGMQPPARCRAALNQPRGFLGFISAYFTAHETSQAGAQHSHSQIHGAWHWSLLSALAEDKELNDSFGKFMNSIVTTQIPYGPEPLGWTQHEKKYEPFTFDGKELTVGTEEFVKILHVGLSHKQNHEFHNFSCFKLCRNPTDKCRFGFPWSSFNHPSGIYQVEVFHIKEALEGSGQRLPNQKQLGILREVAKQPRQTDLLDDDERNLFVILSRRSKAPNADGPDYAVCSYADFMRSNNSNKHLSFPDDLNCRNQWFVDCSATVSIATNFAQNNLQVSDAGAGIYLCKYISKGDGTKLTHCLPMLYEAVKVSNDRPSVALDADSNPMRGAMRTLSRIINNQVRSSEFSVSLCLSHLLGMKQFECSHNFRFVYAHALRLHLLGQNERKNNNSESQSELPADHAIRSEWTVDANAEDSNGSLEVTQNGVVLVSQALDYLHRPPPFKHHSPLEFFITTIKVKKPDESKGNSKSDEALGVEEDNNPELYDANIEESAEPANFAPVAPDEVDSDLEPLLPPPPPPPSSSSSGKPHAGPSKDGGFSFGKGHPQCETHEIRLAFKMPIPILAGQHAPSYPKGGDGGHLPLLNNPKEIEEWLKEADNFGSYYVALLCPWEFSTGKPKFSLNWQGFKEWRESNPPRFLTQYCKNCIDNPSGEGYRLASHFLRNRASHTKETYEKKYKNMRKEGDAANSDVNMPQSQIPQEERERVSNSQREGNNSEAVSDQEVQATISTLLDRFAQAAIDAAGIGAKVSKQALRNQETVIYLSSLLKPQPQHAVPQAASGANSHSAASGPGQVALQAATDYSRFIELKSTLDAINNNIEKLIKATLAVDSNNIINYADVDMRPRYYGPPGHSNNSSSIGSSVFYPPRIIIPATFSPTQRKLCERIIDLKDRNGQILELLLGGPGTGKTFVANFIRSLFGEGESVTIVSAPTGKAASHHDGGTTIQSCFSLGINLRQLKALKRSDFILLAAKFENARLLILDEISMIQAPLLALVSERLKELLKSKLPFGGKNVLMLGDFQQLDPVGGRPLMMAALDILASEKIKEAQDKNPTNPPPASDVLYAEAGNLMRNFRLNILAEQQRSVDISHTKIVQMISETAKPYPVSEGILSSTCHHCISIANDGNRMTDPLNHQSGDPQCPLRCPHRCLHLKELNAMDVREDPSWVNATVVSPLNCTVNAWTLEALKIFALRTKQPIVRWLLPDFSQKGPMASKLYKENAVFKRIMDEKFDLWGYYAKGAPIIFGLNINTAIGIANGSRGVLHSLVGVTDEDIEKYERTPAGTVITLSSLPLAVNVAVTGLKHGKWIRKEIQNSRDGEEDPIIGLPVMGLPTLDKVSYKKEVEVEIARDGFGPLNLKVVYSGFDLAFASTVHKVQGDTLEKVVVDLNKNPSAGGMLDLPCMYVLISRVKRAHDLRVVPWIPRLGKDHLLKLQPNETYIRFMKSFDANGNFKSQLIPPIRQSESLKRKALADISNGNHGGAEGNRAKRIRPMAAAVASSVQPVGGAVGQVERRSRRSSVRVHEAGPVAAEGEQENVDPRGGQQVIQ